MAVDRKERTLLDPAHTEQSAWMHQEVGVSLKPRLLSVRDSAAYAATSRSTLYAAMKAGKLNYIKMGASTRIEVSELDRWINETAEAA